MIKACKRCGILFNAKTCEKHCLACRHEVFIERHREYSRRYYHANREKCYAALCRWRQKNREHYLQKCHEYNRRCYEKRKLKLIREILSATATVLNRKEHIT